MTPVEYRPLPKWRDIILPIAFGYLAGGIMSAMILAALLFHP